MVIPTGTKILKRTMSMTFTQLEEYIQTYCSDTFGAESSEITPAETTQVAEALIQEMVTHHVDGVILDQLLYDIREDKAYENSTRPTTT